MFRRFMKKRLAVVGLAAIGALALAVGAYAYFTSNGTGSSSATAGSASNYTVSVNPAGTTNLVVPLYPTAPDDPNFATLYQPYAGVVTNTDAGKQQVSLLTAAITSVDPVAGDTCTADNFTLYSPNGGWTVASGGQSATTNASNTATSPGLPDDMPGNATLDYSDIAVYLADNNSDQNGCQGATVNVSVTAS